MGIDNQIYTRKEVKFLERPRGNKNKYKFSIMIKKIDAYIKDNEYPILKECCIQNNWDYSYFFKLVQKDADLYQAYRRLVDTKEVFLEKGLLNGKLIAPGAIFALKQLGWKDKPDNNLDDAIDDINKNLFELSEVLKKPQAQHKIQVDE